MNMPPARLPFHHLAAPAADEPQPEGFKLAGRRARGLANVPPDRHLSGRVPRIPLSRRIKRSTQRIKRSTQRINQIPARPPMHNIPRTSLVEGGLMRTPSQPMHDSQIIASSRRRPEYPPVASRPSARSGSLTELRPVSGMPAPGA
ncbi:hypothetical protein PGTUg99_003321 [Puccinia graminis f. sp. tritici]|uniref:Uncharacterized protein n=1 Tax=Puccinia graminis f. sp. tritici TaxID=56615 RepID=A0A5B0RCL1_PUCGR|nr:hypothetical protein PGTUg99_003270 [Puccinia graminis f. sp. tritici]KAA1122735.1 hypothetical protein PGTUg99_003321 [Puccinia graminis f. sp. tritici]